MKALVLKSPGELEVMDVPPPALTAGFVLVEVSWCGICGSDVRYFHGENPWARHTLGRDVPNPPNIILGHELAGTVVEVHDAADEHLIGKRVGVNTWIGCGQCRYCRGGRENFCPQTKHLGHGQGWGEMDFYPGGLAEYCPAWSSHVYELPGSVSDEEATFLDPLITAIHVVATAPPAGGDDVVVIGGGPIGLMIAQLAKLQGARQVFVADVADQIVAIARSLGADHALNIADSPAGLTELVMAGTGGHGVARVFNTVGSAESINQSLGLLDCAGVLVLVATKGEEISFPALALSGERTVKTSTNSLYRDFPKAIDLLARGKMIVEPMITHRLTLDEAPQAIRLADDKAAAGAIKIIVDCHK